MRDRPHLITPSAVGPASRRPPHAIRKSFRGRWPRRLSQQATPLIFWKKRWRWPALAADWRQKAKLAALNELSVSPRKRTMNSVVTPFREAHHATGKRQRNDPQDH